MRAVTEIHALAFAAEASRTGLAQFHRVGGSVDDQFDRRDRACRDYRTPVLTAPLAVPPRGR
jgi:hypothetical protein